jgi:hemoglobin-like flavoprotein
MNQNAVTLVQASWSRVQEQGDVAMSLFQRNLLEQRPWLTALYTGYVDGRDNMVLRTFGRAVMGMHKLDTHAALLMQIGRINAICGMQPHHYPYFEVALIQTLEQLLGEDFFAQPLREAWTAVFGTMTRLVLAGANGQPAAAVAIRQRAADRRRQRRRVVLELGGNRGYHRRSGGEANRRLSRTSSTGTSTQRVAQPSV